MSQQISLTVHHHLGVHDILAHLENVEYIIMATPNTDPSLPYPIHFTIFLNTHEELPYEVKDAVLDKFCEQYDITSKAHVMSELAPVGFAQTDKEALMPMHLFKKEDQGSIPHVYLHVIDFLGDAKGFKEVKEDDQTGWSYSYN